MGIASESYWADRFTEASNKNVGHGSFAAFEVAHGMPWNVEQPVRRDCPFTLIFSGKSSTGNLFEGS